MWKWITAAAVAALLLLIFWPYLFPAASPASIIGPVNTDTGAGYGYTDAAGNQVTAYGAGTVQVTQNTGIAAAPKPILGMTGGGKL